MVEGGLFVNLVLALAAAWIGGLVAVRLGQSAILGYILAGVAIGPFTPGPVASARSVQELADIGVILLLFTIGVQYSLRDLLRAGPVATVGGSVQVVVSIALGYLGGRALGWDELDALFLGAVVSSSSSTVLGKILGERGETGSEHGRVAMAWSTVQDLSTIVLVVVLSALGTGTQNLAVDLGWALAKAGMFLFLLLVVGARTLPWLFEAVAALRSREVFVLTVVALALGTAYLASLAGLSLALGAFVAGVAVGESDLAHQIVGELVPLRDLFAGLFFVSIGMLVDPRVVLATPEPVLLAIALIVPLKSAVVAAISLLFRLSPRTSLLAGVALGQSGEFSFLLASLGASIGAVSPAAFNAMLGGAVVSIVAAPVLHRAAEPVVRWVDRRLPSPALARRPADETPRLRGHAVICGFGRVGRIIGEALARRGLRFAVIDMDIQVVRALRAEGILALLGDAGNPLLLDRVSLDTARILIVAIPDPLSTRQVVDYARTHHPHLDVVARTHSVDERVHLYRLGVGEAVFGEVELAAEMLRRTLHRFGIHGSELQMIVQGLRRRGESGEP